MVITTGPDLPHIDASELTDEERANTPFAYAITRQDPDPLEDECWSWTLKVKLDVPELRFPYQKQVTSTRRRTNRRNKQNRRIYETKNCQIVGVGYGLLGVDFEIDVKEVGDQPENRRPYNCTLPPNDPIKMSDFCDKLVEILGDAIEKADTTAVRFGPLRDESKTLTIELGEIANGIGVGGIFPTEAAAEKEMQEILKWDGEKTTKTTDIGLTVMGALADQGVSSAQKVCWSDMDAPADVADAKRAAIDKWLEKLCKILFDAALKKVEFLRGFLE